MPIAGSRKVQVCKRQRDEAEGKRCESHNPSAAQPVLVPAPSVPGDASLTTSQRSRRRRRRRRKEKENTPFQVPVTLTTGWIGVTCKWLRVLQLKSHCDETYLGIFTCAKSIRTSDACPLGTFSSHTFCFVFPVLSLERQSTTFKTNSCKSVLIVLDAL